MSKPIASVFVEFPRPLKGSELMAIVKRICETAEYPKDFYSEERFDNGYVFSIGQSSYFDPASQLVVAPSHDSFDVRPEHEYSGVVVMNHGWPVETCLAGYEDYRDAVIQSVRSFAEALSTMVK